MNTSLLIAAAGRDAEAVRRAGLCCLHLCAVLSDTGQFTVLSRPRRTQGDLLGIVDRSGTPPASPRSFASAAVSLARSRGCAGIFADFSRTALTPLVEEFDRQTALAGLSFWIPLSFAEAAPHGIYVAETAVSGGSLCQRFEALAEQYGADRIAAQFVRSCAQFSIPSPTADGTPMSFEQAEQLRQRVGATSFFSHELCARYFTYMEHGSARFVLFDDDDTLKHKRQLLTERGITRQLFLYPDAVSLGLLAQ